MSEEPQSIRQVKPVWRATTTEADRKLDFRVDELEKLKSWLVEKSSPLVHPSATEKKNGIYLLSHHDDGIVWGTMENGSLFTSAQNDHHGLSHTPSPALRVATLQECRLFSPHGELFIWRADESSFGARLVLDFADEAEGQAHNAKEKDCFDEKQVLWGRWAEQHNDHFTVVREGQGVRHAFPLKIEDIAFGSQTLEDKRQRPLRLIVRHYLGKDDDGCLRIALTRLCNLYCE